MDKQKLAQKLLKEIEKIYPDAKTELANWKTPFQFLVCIILSAQTTDKQVNRVTKELFNRFPDASKMSKANVGDIERLVGSVNYFKTKSRHIKEMSEILNRNFNGIPPRDVNKLVILPGVGYKTANVFLNDLYRSNQGIAVDTHVARVAKAYGLTKNIELYKIAKDLEKLYPRKDWYKVNSSFVLYGRYILKAKNPDIDKIVLKRYLIKSI